MFTSRHSHGYAHSWCILFEFTSSLLSPGIKQISKLPHNRRHGFSKRFNPARVLQLIHHKLTTHCVENLNHGIGRSILRIPMENLNLKIAQSILEIPVHKTFEQGKTNPARPPDVSTNPIGAVYLVLRTRRISDAYGGLIEITQAALGGPAQCSRLVQRS